MLKFGKKKKDAAAQGEDADAVAAPDAGTEGGAEGEGEDGATPKKKKLPMLLVIGAAALVVLGGGGGAAWFLFLKPAPAGAEDGHAAPTKKGGDGGHGEASAEADPALGQIRAGPDGVTFYTMPDLIVNIQSTDGRPTFLKLKLTLEMSDPHLAETLQGEAPRLQDMFQGFLRELRPEDLAGSAGSHQLRMEILRRVNLIAAPGQVDAVLIEEMLIQ